MELWKIALTAIGLMLSVLLIAFRQRQLYVFIPKMFEYTPFADNGRVVSLTLINRGWYMEEELRLEMPPEVKVELLAADSAGVEEKKGLISIGRLPQRSEVRLVLLVESSHALSDFSPKLTSKTSRGKIFKNEDVPSNIGLMAVLLFAIIALLSALGYLILEQTERSAVLARKSAEMDRRAERARSADLERSGQEIRELNEEIDRLVKINNDNRAQCSKVSDELLVARLDLRACQRQASERQ